MSVSPGRDNYAAMHANFRWHVPERFNIADWCCGRWARASDADTRVAIRAHGEIPRSSPQRPQGETEVDRQARPDDRLDMAGPFRRHRFPCMHQPGPYTHPSRFVAVNSVAVPPVSRRARQSMKPASPS